MKTKSKRFLGIILSIFILVFCITYIPVNASGKEVINGSSYSDLTNSPSSLSNYKLEKLGVGNTNDYQKKSTPSKSSKTTSSSSSGSYSGGGSIGSLLSLLSLPGIIVIVVIALIIYWLSKKGIIKNDLNGTSTSEDDSIIQISPPDVIVKDNTNMISQALIETDPLFSAGKFIAWGKEVFISLQLAWSTRDWSKIRPFEKEELFRLHEMQLNEFKALGRINLLESVFVSQTYLHKYVRDAEYEYLTLYMYAAMNDYVIDETTRQVVKGNPNTRYYGKYMLTFMRSVKVKTDPATSNMSTRACPHCGAPIQITSAGKCEYCDFIITNGEHDWVLSSYDCIKTDTNIDDGGVTIN